MASIFHCDFFCRLSLLLFLLQILAFQLVDSSICRSLPFPKAYVAYHLASGDTINIDGKLNEKAWMEVEPTEKFVGRFDCY